MNNSIFEIEIHSMTGGIERLERVGCNGFNWTQGRFGIPYGINFLDNTEISDNIIKQKYSYFTYLDVLVERELTNKGLKEKYTFKNCGDKPLEFKKGELGIYATFADSVDIEDTLARRARSHIWCGQNSSFIYNARLDGKPDGVGLVLLEGSFIDYEEEDASKCTRGDIALKMPALKLAPAETYDIEWLIFAYESQEEFLRVLNDNNILLAKVSNYYPIKGEEITINANADKAVLNGKEYSFSDKAAKIVIEHEGEQRIELFYGDKRTDVLVYSGAAKAQDISDYLLSNGKKSIFSPKNTATPIIEAQKNVEWYKKVEDEGYLALAAVDLFRYYEKFKGEKRADMAIPIIYLAKNEELLKRFKNQIINALSAKGKYSLYRELATIDMLLSAYSIWSEEGYLVALNQRLKRLKNWLGIQPHYKYFNRAYLTKDDYMDGLDFISVMPISAKEQTLRDYLCKQ